MRSPAAGAGVNVTFPVSVSTVKLGLLFEPTFGLTVPACGFVMTRGIEDRNLKGVNDHRGRLQTALKPWSRYVIVTLCYRHIL